jgi:hypothetical protein
MRVSLGPLRVVERWPGQELTRRMGSMLGERMLDARLVEVLMVPVEVREADESRKLSSLSGLT